MAEYPPTTESHDRPKPGDNLSERDDGQTWDAQTKSNAEIREQALAFSEGFAPGLLG